MNGIFAEILRSFPVPFHHSLGLLRSYHIPKKMDSVPERELFFPFLNMYVNFGVKLASDESSMYAESKYLKFIIFKQTFIITKFAN